MRPAIAEGRTLKRCGFRMQVETFPGSRVPVLRVDGALAGGRTEHPVVRSLSLNVHHMTVLNNVEHINIDNIYIYIIYT